MTDYLSEAQALFDYSQSLRRDFHRHPELGFQERRTAGIVSRELNDLGLEVTTGIAKTGVVALLEGEGAGPVVLLRFDMDALPIHEETGAEYASQNPGVMHACGHDGHTAIGLTVARLLNEHRKELAGTVKLVFQPAEEGLGGAARMVSEGVLENPRPEVSMALHLWNEMPIGWVGVSDSAVMAAADIFRIQLTGKGGHGALPQLTKDPVLAAAQVITALQSIISRNVPPMDMAVISVTTLRGGEAFNVIPGEVELKGTVRTFQTSVREKVLERFNQVVKGVAEAFDCGAEIELQSLTPPVINHASIAARVQKVAGEVLPDSQLRTNYSTTVSEDMAFMMQEIPGCFFLVGSANPEKGLGAAHHNPRFDFDEQVLPRAAALMAASAAELLKGSDESR